MNHQHYWCYEHAVYRGRQERTDRTVQQHEVGVVRYCACGMKQMAFTSSWQKPPKTYDLSHVGKP